MTTTTDNTKYQVFTRTWYRKDPEHPGSLIPHPGRKTILTYVYGREAAVKKCREWNATHPAGPLSRKAEFTSDF